MRCPSCSTDNDSAAQFCMSCGSELAMPGNISTINAVRIPTWLVSGWGSAAGLGFAVFFMEFTIHLLIGSLAAIAQLLRVGVLPDSLSGLFTSPLRSLVAAGGGVPSVGLWATPVLVGYVAVKISLRRRTGSTESALPVAAIVAGKAGFVHALVMVITSLFVEPMGLAISRQLELPGNLANLSSVQEWAYGSMLVTSFIVVAVPTLILTARLKSPTRSLVQGAASSVSAATFAAGLLAVLGGAMQLPTQATGRVWAAQLLEYVSTAGLAITDIGARYLAASVTFWRGDIPPPVRGLFAPAILVVSFVAVVLVLRRGSDELGPLQLTGQGFAAGCLIALIGVVNENDSAILAASPGLVVALSVAGATASPRIRNAIEASWTEARHRSAAATDSEVAECQCGAAIGQGDRFCGSCGSLVGD